MKTRALRLGLAAAVAASALYVDGGVARADEPGPNALPITVVAVQTNDADDQAEALTKAVRNAVRSSVGWSLGEGDYSLEVLALSLKCPDTIDASCESRIADQIRAERYIWGAIGKKGGNVAGDLHLWVRGKGSTKVPLNYSANLTEPNDDSLKRVATDAVQQLTGGPPSGSVNVRAGNLPGQVFVDGKPLGALTAAGGTFALPAGQHTIVVRAQGFSDAQSLVQVKPNGTAEVSLTLLPLAPESKTDWRKVGGAVSLGVGVASAVVGFVSMLPVTSVQNDDVFKGYAAKFTSDVDVCSQAKGDNTTAGQDVASKCSKAKTFEVVQAVTFPLAAVASGVGIYLLATSNWSGKKAAPAQPQTGFSVSPLVGPQAGKLDVTYRW
jgi:hypothetical protein